LPQHEGKMTDAFRGFPPSVPPSPFLPASALYPSILSVPSVAARPSPLSPSLLSGLRCLFLPPRLGLLLDVLHLVLARLLGREFLGCRAWCREGPRGGRERGREGGREGGRERRKEGGREIGTYLDLDAASVCAVFDSPISVFPVLGVERGTAAEGL